MHFFIGTSGFSYKEWKGSFYPKTIKADEMLGYYAGQLNSVEINSSFYRMPRAETLAQWASKVPGDFTFSLKVSRRITHFKQLRECDELLGYVLRSATQLGATLGPLLVQLPANFPKNTERLEDFLSITPKNRRFVFEFRHTSWHDEDVYSLLSERNAAVCFSDDQPREQIQATANWGYARLRRVDYTERDLNDWASILTAQPWQKAFVYFKHEDGADGARLAQRFRQLTTSAAQPKE